MIGDTPYNVEAARRAHVRVIAFECGGWGRADLRGATAIYRDASDLLDRYEESLLASALTTGRPAGSAAIS